MFSFNFTRIREYISRFIRPSLYMSGFDYFLRLWHDADTKNKGILLLIFSPMFLSMAGLVFSIIYFVLFVLPSFLFRFIGWGILTALFGAGGRYFYQYLTGTNTSSSSASASSAYTSQSQPDYTAQEVHEVIDVQYVEAKHEEPEPPSSSSERKTSRRRTR